MAKLPLRLLQFKLIMGHQDNKKGFAAITRSFICKIFCFKPPTEC